MGIRASRRALLRAMTVAAAPPMLLGCAAPARAPAPLAERPLAVVYRGPAAYPDCSVAAKEALDAGGAVRTAYVGPHEKAQLDWRTLAAAALYVHPGGGDLEPAWHVMAQDAALLADWVRGGGRYLGLCLGAYLAGDDPGFALWPGKVFDYISTPRAEVTTPAPAVVQVTWRDTVKRLYFQDGTAFSAADDRAVTPLASYRNGQLASASAPVGSGRVTLTGPHPEAPLSWFRDDRLTPPGPWDAALWADLEATALG